MKWWHPIAAAVAALIPTGARAAPAPKTRLDLAFVLLATPKLPREQDVIRAFATFAPKEKPLRPQPKSPSDSPDDYKQALAFALGPDAGALVMLMPAAVPKGEADEAAKYSVRALGTGWKLPAHKAHLIVTCSQPAGAPRIESLARFTALLAAVAKAAGAVGVYWGNSGATHDPAFLMDVARESELEARMMVWSGISVAREPGGRLSLLSLGMKQLDLPDLLLTSPPGKNDEALSYFFTLLAYVAGRGKAIADGETVGRTAQERLKVKYVPSPVDKGKKVWRVELP